MKINKFQKWLLRKIAKKIVQGGNHKDNLTEYYGIIVKESRKQFSEDSLPMLKYFLEECHNNALEKYNK